MSRVTPCLWFNGDAEAAVNFYVSLLPDSAVSNISRCGEGMPFPAGTALMVEFSLAGQRYQALNGGPQYPHTEAFSLSVSCANSESVDRYWYGLIANGGTQGQCGWLKDRFGVSWQIVPEGLSALLSDPDAGRRARAAGAMMQMKKLDLSAMQAAADAVPTIDTHAQGSKT